MSIENPFNNFKQKITSEEIEKNKLTNTEKETVNLDQDIEKSPLENNSTNIELGMETDKFIKQDSENRQEFLEEKFKKFMYLMGEKHNKYGETYGEVFNDFKEDALNGLNLNESELKEFNDYLNNKISLQNENGDGFYKLKLESVDFYKNEKETEKKAVEKERLEKMSPQERISENIHQAESLSELAAVLKPLGGVRGSSQNFKSEQIVNLFEKLLNTNENINIKDITRTYGLRDKAINLLEKQIREVQTFEELKIMTKKLCLKDEQEIISQIDKIKDGAWINSNSNIISRANELQGLHSNKKQDDFNQLMRDDKGYIRGKILGQTPGGSYIVNTPQGKMEVNNLKDIRNL